MTLRRQLLLVSLLLLSLPWAGCQFIREMEGALRHGQSQSLQATADAVAAVLAQQPALLYPETRRRRAAQDRNPSIYAVPATQPVIVDGYADGWEEIGDMRFDATADARPLGVRLRAQTQQGNLYLLLQVEDPEVVYHNPGLSREPNGDRLVLRTWRDGRRQEYVIATAAPGSVRARAASRRQRGLDPGRIRGYWQDAQGGYNLELEIPLDYTGERLGFFLVNASRGEGGPFEYLGNANPLDTSAPPWLIHSPAALQQALQPFASHGSRIQVIDQAGWLLADLSPSRADQPRASETFWLLRLLYRSILAEDQLQPSPPPAGLGRPQGEEFTTALEGQQANLRYRDPDRATRTHLVAAAPIRDGDGVFGAVILRQSGEQYLSLTDQAFSRLLGYSLLAIGGGALGLLGYASLLSWRIRKLSRAAGEVVREDGAILDNFPRSNAADEIGELSRRYADLLDQLREYNDYLRTLSRKLSHELRTPIAVIQTSLENLEQADPPATAQAVYLERAREGLTRLNRILTAMSEASRLEESIRNNTLQQLDLVGLLKEVAAAYDDVYPDQMITLVTEVDTAPAQGVPELLIQALDKLMDNASSFTPTGGDIIIGLQGDGPRWQLSVSNQGPTLPAELQERLFDPMVSLREEEGRGVHLGLGLHIVRLIAEFHRGRVRARNRPAGDGVVVTIEIPS